MQHTLQKQTYFSLLSFFFFSLLIFFIFENIFLNKQYNATYITKTNFFKMYLYNMTTCNVSFQLFKLLYKCTLRLV